MAKEPVDKQVDAENREPLKEMRLGSGELVVDRPDSHLHDNIKELIDEVLAKVNSEGRDLIEAEIDLGRIVGNRALVETGEGDTIVYGQRPNRKGLTRFAKGREVEPYSYVTVVLRKNKQEKERGVNYTLLTAFVGRITPMEPWADFSKRPNPEAEQIKAKEFWENHALVYGEEPIIPGTETDVCPW